MLTGCSKTTSENTSASSDTHHPEYACRMINYYDYGKPVPETTDPVDDSYFQDAFLAGDSRMGSLYLYSNLRDKGAEIHYAESLSLYTMYTTNMDDVQETMYSLLQNTDKSHIYILLGVNEIRSENFDSWGETYDGLIQELKEEHPSADIYMMGSYHPRAVSGLDADQLTNQLNMLNGKMQEIANNEHVYFYDTNDDLLDDQGLVREELVWDGLHFNQQGSQLFADEIAKHVVRKEDYVKKVCE